MIRTHNVGSPLGALNAKPQQPFKRKPEGLWWSPDNAWRSLVEEGVSPGLYGRQIGAYDYAVTLNDEFRLLVLETAGDLMDFSREFGQPMPHAKEGFFWQKPGTRSHYDPDQDPKMPERARAFLINWPEVARRWDGIEIPDLLTHVDRPQIDWLDTDWGVASGCAWNPEHLEIALIEHTPGPQM
jgi:hypothetical protein